MATNFNNIIDAALNQKGDISPIINAALGVPNTSRPTPTVQATPTPIVTSKSAATTPRITAPQTWKNMAIKENFQSLLPAPLRAAYIEADAMQAQKKKDKPALDQLNIQRKALKLPALSVLPVSIKEEIKQQNDINKEYSAYTGLLNKIKFKPPVDAGFKIPDNVPTTALEKPKTEWQAVNEHLDKYQTDYVYKKQYDTDMRQALANQVVSSKDNAQKLGWSWNELGNDIMAFEGNFVDGLTQGAFSSGVLKDYGANAYSNIPDYKQTLKAYSDTSPWVAGGGNLLGSLVSQLALQSLSVQGINKGLSLSQVSMNATRIANLNKIGIGLITQIPQSVFQRDSVEQLLKESPYFVFQTLFFVFFCFVGFNFLLYVGGALGKIINDPVISKNILKRLYSAALVKVPLLYRATTETTETIGQMVGDIAMGRTQWLTDPSFAAQNFGMDMLVLTVSGLMGVDGTNKAAILKSIKKVRSDFDVGMKAAGDSESLKADTRIKASAEIGNVMTKFQVKNRELLAAKDLSLYILKENSASIQGKTETIKQSRKNLDTADDTNRLMVEEQTKNTAKQSPADIAEQNKAAMVDNPPRATTAKNIVGDTFTPRAVEPEVMDFSAKLYKAFGVDIVYGTYGKKINNDSFYGMYNPDNNTSIINADPPKNIALESVAMHEVLHGMKVTNPEAYAQLIKSVQGSILKSTELQRRVGDLVSTKSGKTSTDVQEEYLSDVVMELTELGGSKFWDGVLKENGEGGVAKVFNDMKRVQSIMRSSGYKSSAMLNGIDDIGGVIKNIESALIKFKNEPKVVIDKVSTAEYNKVPNKTEGVTQNGEQNNGTAAQGQNKGAKVGGNGETDNRVNVKRGVQPAGDRSAEKSVQLKYSTSKNPSDFLSQLTTAKSASTHGAYVETKALAKNVTKSAETVQKVTKVEQKTIEPDSNVVPLKGAVNVESIAKANIDEVTAKNKAFHDEIKTIHESLVIKRANSLSGEKALDKIEDIANRNDIEGNLRDKFDDDLNEARDLLEEYKGITRSDYDDAEYYNADKEEAWDNFLNAVDVIELKLKVPKSKKVIPISPDTKYAQPEGKRVPLKRLTNRYTLKQTVVSAYESGKLPVEAKNRIAQASEAVESFKKEFVSSKALEKKYIAQIKNGDVEGLQNAWDTFVKQNKLVKSADIAKATTLLQHYGNMGTQGGLDKMESVLIDLANIASDTGRSLQAMQLIAGLSSKGYRKSLERQLNSLNIMGFKKYGGKWNDFTLTDAEKTQLDNTNPTDTFAREVIKAKIAARIASDIPTNTLDALTAWRKLSMLSSIRTHMRNVLSNVAYMPIRKFDNAVATLLDTFIKNPNSKVHAVFADRTLIETARKYYVDNVSKTLSALDKDIANPRNVFGAEVPAFGDKSALSRVLNKIGRKNRWLMNDFEDVPFYKMAYIRTAADYMKAQGIKEINNDVHSYATAKALEATYKQTNGLINWIETAKKSGKVLSTVVDVAVPFVRTPVNIVMRGIEHSPVSFLTGATNLVKYLKGNDYSFVNKQGAVKTTGDPMLLRKAIDDFSSGFTGSALITLGAMLFNSGVFTPPPEDDYLLAQYKRDVGESPYAIRFGSTYVPINWIQPTAIPLIVGISVAHKFLESGVSWTGLAQSATSGFDTVFDLPFLKGVQDLFGSKSAGATGTVTGALKTLLTSYASQMLPTMFSDISKATQENIKTRWTNTLPDSEDQKFFGTLPEFLRTYTRTVASKIAPQLLEDKIDVWGNPVKGAVNTPWRVIQSFVSPFTTSTEKQTPVDRELVRLAKIDPNNQRIYPNLPPKYVLNNGAQIALTPKDYTQYAKTSGQTAFNALDSIISTSEYMALDDNGKAKIYEMVQNYAGQKAANGVLVKNGLSSLSYDGNYDRISSELIKVYADNYKEGVSTISFPRNAGSSLTFNGKKFELSSTEQASFEKVLNDKSIEYLNKIINSKNWQLYNGTNKYKLVQDYLAKARNVAVTMFVRQNYAK